MNVTGKSSLAHGLSYLIIEKESNDIKYSDFMSFFVVSANKVAKTSDSATESISMGLISEFDRSYSGDANNFLVLVGTFDYARAFPVTDQHYKILITSNK